MKLLMFDIETSPALVYTFSLFKPIISIEQVVEPTRMLCFTARWYGTKKTLFYSEHHHGRQTMVEKMHELLNDADAVVHYNGKSFDVKHVNREFLLAGLAPPAPYQQIDLYLESKRNFAWLSGKLQWLATQLEIGSKVKHSGFGLWRRCLDGDPKAWAEMKRYALTDTDLLIDAYEALLPWIGRHPNVALIDSREGACPRCGSDKTQRRGFKALTTGTYPQYQCQECKGWFRGTHRVGGADVTAVAA